MSRDEIFKNVQNIIEEIAEVPKSEIKKESTVVGDLNLTSLSILSIISEIEQKYNIFISESDLISISTIDELVDLICKSMVEK